eukprot:485597-Prymnesium_polylepis.1
MAGAGAGAGVGAAAGGGARRGKCRRGRMLSATRRGTPLLPPQEAQRGAWEWEERDIEYGGARRAPSGARHGRRAPSS